VTGNWLLRSKEKPKEYRNARYRKKLLYLKLKQGTKEGKISERNHIYCNNSFYNSRKISYDLNSYIHYSKNLKKHVITITIQSNAK